MKFARTYMPPNSEAIGGDPESSLSIYTKDYVRDLFDKAETSFLLLMALAHGPKTVSRAYDRYICSVPLSLG